MITEPIYNISDRTLDPAPPIRADDESGMRERATRTKDNSGPTLQITQKGNRAEGPYTHNTTTTVTHHLHVSAPATCARSALPLHASSLALCDATWGPRMGPRWTCQGVSKLVRVQSCQCMCDARDGMVVHWFWAWVVQIHCSWSWSVKRVREKSDNRTRWIYGCYSHSSRKSVSLVRSMVVGKLRCASRHASSDPSRASKLRTFRRRGHQN